MRDTPTYFAERLYKAMKVRQLFPVLIKMGEREKVRVEVMAESIRTLHWMKWHVTMF